MSIGTVFVNNRTQAVRLPLDVRLPEGVHKVEIRARGNERIIAPLGQTWDSFFLGRSRCERRLPARARQSAPTGARSALMLRYLLDTNIVIYVLKRRPVEVLSTFNANASRMAISSITLAELLHGAEKSSRVSENLSAIEDFCSRLHVLPYGAKAALQFR